MSPTELVYGNLLAAHHQALRKGELDRANRIFLAAAVFLDLWPEDVKRWEDRFPDKTTNHVPRASNPET